MKTIVDSVFGELEYKHSWIKTESLSWGGRLLSITIIASTYSNEEISEQQRASYQAYKEKVDTIISDSKKELSNFIKVNYGLNALSLDEMSSGITPRSVVFEQDGTWAILFDSSWDDDNGIALVLDAKGVQVMSEDDFL